MLASKSQSATPRKAKKYFVLYFNKTFFCLISRPLQLDTVFRDISEPLTPNSGLRFQVSSVDAMPRQPTAALLALLCGKSASRPTAAVSPGLLLRGAKTLRSDSAEAEPGHWAF